MSKTVVTRPVTAILVEWFCECGGQLVAMSNTGRVQPHPQFTHLPLMIYAHKCQKCHVQVESPDRYPYLRPGE